jgi:hypothetical protein
MRRERYRIVRHLRERLVGDRGSHHRRREPDRPVFQGNGADHSNDDVTYVAHGPYSLTEHIRVTIDGGGSIRGDAGLHVSPRFNLLAVPEPGTVALLAAGMLSLA